MSRNFEHIFYNFQPVNTTYKTKFYSSNALETLKPKYKAVLACLLGALMGGIREKMEDENLATRYTRKHVKRLIPVWPTWFPSAERAKEVMTLAQSER